MLVSISDIQVKKHNRLEVNQYEQIKYPHPRMPILNMNLSQCTY